jgi:hypothetical protein
MEEFRKSLIDLTKAVQVETLDAHEDESEDATEKIDPTEPEHRKLVIVVDELDRCRPDYALSLLEIIKHFFDVPHVHFVLGVNMSELENSVKARYGAGINAGLYLQKFVKVTMGLPHKLNNGLGGKVSDRYFETIAKQMRIENGLISTMLHVAASLKDTKAVSLRSYERLASTIALTSASLDRHADYRYEFTGEFLSSLLIMKAWFPSEYAKAIDGTLTMGVMDDLFEIPPYDASKSDYGTFQVIDEMEYHLDPKTHAERYPDPNRRPPRTAAQSMKEFQSLLTQKVEVFSLG